MNLLLTLPLAASLLTFAPASTVPAQADDDLPPGLQSARLLAGWTDESGTRISALELVLEPGWKTYWRNPGDTGLPPSFDWSAAANMAEAEIIWPAPQTITSDGETTLGYHDRLILPIKAAPRDPSQPVALTADIEVGLCERVCVPGNLTLTAPPPGDSPDPVITRAMALVPQPLPGRTTCQVSEIADGMRVTVDLPAALPPLDAAALELHGRDDVWVSSAIIADGGITAEFVAPSGAPFDLDTGNVVATFIHPDGATEMRGCDRAG